MYQYLRKISEILAEALNRCEYCGQEGEIFDCPECAKAKMDYLDAITDLVKDQELYSDARLMRILDITKPMPKLGQNIQEE